jgi:hypothetical protein
VAGLKGDQNAGGGDVVACTDIGLSRWLADLPIVFCLSVAAGSHRREDNFCG